MNTFTKSLLSLILLFLIVGFSACKKDEFDQKTIRGTWECVESGGKDDPYYTKTETYSFDKFNIGMYYLEEWRGEEQLSKKTSSIDYSIFENTLTITLSDGEIFTYHISIENDMLIMSGARTKVFKRIIKE